MSASEDVPAFFRSMGSGSPKPRHKFCGVFCPVEGATDSKTLDLSSVSPCRGDGRVIDKQGDVGRKVEIRTSAGKEALQNLGDTVGTGGAFVRSHASVIHPSLLGSESGFTRPFLSFLKQAHLIAIEKCTRKSKKKHNMFSVHKKTYKFHI